MMSDYDVSSWECILLIGLENLKLFKNVRYYHPFELKPSDFINFVLNY